MKSVCFACGAEFSEQHEKCPTCRSTHIAEVMRAEPIQKLSASAERTFGMREVCQLLRTRGPWLFFTSSSTEPAQPHKPIDIEELEGFSYLLAKGWQWLRLFAAALAVLGVIGAVLYGILFLIASVVMSSMRMGNH